MHKFFYEQRKAFSFRKLTIGLVSLCVGTSLLFGIQSQEVSASTVSPSQIRFEYVLEAELSAEERQLIQSSLPAELKEEATYFVVYRPSKKVLPATGELAGSGLAVLGLGFLVLAVSATKSKKARVLTMLYVTTSGLALPVLEVGAVQSSALAAYNQTLTIRPGDSLPDGKLRLDGYDFVGYYVQESSVKTSLPPSETEKNDVAKGTQASSVQSEGKKSDLEELAKPSVLQENSESQLSNRDDSLQLPLKESSVEKTENTVSSETTNSQTGDGLASPNTSTIADKKEDSPNTVESQNSGLDSTLQIPGLHILNRKDRTDAVTEVAPIGQALPFVAFRKEKETFALELVKQEDPQLEIGKSRLVPGQEGEKEITYADFVQGEKILRSEKISEQVTKNAVAPIMYVGTKQVEAPVIPLPEVPSSPKVESEISDAGSTDANSSASQHTEQPKPSTPDSAVDLPVPPQPEVRPEVDVPVPPQPETTPETEEPVSPQPEVVPETEEPVSPQPEVVPETEVAVAPQPEVVPETEVPVSPQPELAPETEEPVSPQPELAPETEVPVSPQPELAPETEEPVSPQPELAPETEEPVSPQPELVPDAEEPVSPQPELAPETEVPTTPNTGSTDATSGASQHGESNENPTSQELTEAEIQCILDPSSTCWPEKEEKVEPKVQAQQIEEAAAKLREKMEELQTYKSRFKGKEWADYINTVYEDSRAILETRDLADMLIQTSLIEDDLRFLLIETDANSGASQKTEGELIFELPTSTSETVTPPLTPTTPDSSGSTTPKPADSTTAPSTETEEEFCPIDPKPEDTCGPETSPTDGTPSGEGSSSNASSEETSSSETTPDSSGSTAPKPSDSTTAPSTETEEEFCPIDSKPEENCGVESEPQKEIVSQVEVESTKDVSFIRRYESNDQLEFGETRTKQIGQVGQEKVIETYRLVNGERRERLSIRTENVRQAREEIIEVGTKPTVTKTPIRFTEKEIADGNLYVGDRVIEVHGVDGERTVTTSYRLNTQTGETQPEQPVVTEVAAKEQKVRIGSKPVDETRQVIQDTVVKFTTEFESDVNLSYPETQEITPGKDGLSRTIITRRYIRGQEVGQPSQEKLTITPVQNRRVKVGIKPESRIVETPFQTVYEADSSRQLDTRHTRQEGVNQQITYTKTYSMNSETGQVTAQPETGRLTRQGQNKIIQVGTRPTERTEEIVLETIRRDNSELEKGTVKVIHEGRPTIKRFQKSYTVDVNTGATVAQPEVLLEEIPGQAREEEVGTKEPVQPEVIDSTGSTETTQPEETTKPEQPINPLPEPEQPKPAVPDTPPVTPTPVPEQPSPIETETEPVSPEKTEETTEETVEDVKKPLLRVLKNEPHYHLMKHVRSSKVTYKLDDQYNTFRKAIARLFVNDTEIHQEELTDKNKLEVRFRNLLPNVDYFVKTDLVYTDSNNTERTERLMDEVHIDFEERHFEIKNIDEAEVWKNENGGLVRKVALKVVPIDVQNYFIKLKSDEHKDIFLQVKDIDEMRINGERHFKLQATFTNPEERRQKLSPYHDTVTVYLPREVRENRENRNKYSTFKTLLAAMKADSFGTFELQQDLTASEVVLSDTDKSYLSSNFYGTLKGNGFTIHDLKVPLFNDLRGTVSDLNLKAVDIHLPKETKVGALAMKSENARVNNVFAEGYILSDSMVGGLVGEADRTQFTNVSYTGSLLSISKNDSKLGGIAGWLGGGSITKGYVDATISSASSNVKAGGLVGQLEHANARITSSYVTGRITTTKTKDTEVGGLVGTILKGNDTNNSIQLTDNIVAVNVVNGNKVYGRLDETLRPFSNIRIVTDKATGENNSTEFVTAIDSERAGQELKAWSIRPSEKESEWHLRQKNAFDINYANEKYTVTDRKQAYENMEKLLPFFTRDVIIQHANRLESSDSLVTKKLVDVVPMIDKTPVFDIVQNKDRINRLLLHFEDGTVEKHYLVKKKELGSGAVVEYHLLDKNISYTPETYVRSIEYGPMVSTLVNQFTSIQFESEEVNKVLGLSAHKIEDERKMLFLKESFDTAKQNIEAHLSDLISNYNLVGLDNSAIREYLKSYISKNKVQLLLGLAYMDKWYNIQFGDVNAKNLMMKKADFFGQNVNSLDQLIRIGSMGAEMLKPKNNYALASQVIAKESIGGDLFDYLEGYRKAFVPDKTTNDWFRTTTKATIIETNSRVPEVLEKQTNPTKDIYKNGFYDKMASNHWMYKEMALILLAMPSKDIFILTDMANTLIGMYENNKGVSEERLQEIAKMWAGHADYLYNILPDGHKEKMFRRVVTWDNKKINGSWKDPMDPSPYNLRSAAMKHFYIPLGHPHADRRTGAHADYTIDNIYYFDHEATSDDGARVYTHEMTHVADDDTILLGHGKRTSLDYEVYARGLFESITWGNQDRFGFNNVYDFSKYDKNNYGRRLTNKTPDRFQSTKDLQDYMKGYLDVIYTLDLLEAEAVIGLSDNSAKQNWFAQMTTGDGNTSTVAPVAKVPTSLEQLIKDGMVSRRPYESGYNNYGDYGSNNHSNAYLEVRAFDPIYGSLNNDGTSRNEYEVRKIAFELLAEYGYEKGMVPYLSNQHKASLGKADANGRMNDSDLISLISEKEYKNSAEFRKAMFEKRRQNLEKLKSVELINNSLSNGEGYFYEGTRTVNASELRDLMKAAVEHDARSSNYLSSTIRYNKTQSHVYSLKAAILNGYLRETKDFRESIYKDTP
ncbi:G5 domain-containing protein [Streptococcus suis]|uniref:ZmpA/ZmpB/ZmpC family metallo-endopeptidase n=2 Tax=Streptococcus suis TaxID=1307 RepID=UPI001C9402F0|nr:ZmpA/ZmpB/ZmpC family metallo-endopeptidase [Streptococcus suis]MBY4962546.1 G5 domain-containing protein [Streptococcus suis]MBY4968869.1 G5 domain-containing protein [Streptococcus suis]MBY4979952.1 G5 domain-containing protein [Streptococcus suis]MBY4988525.1 G5 domain-containing protein [Streptococcus suis]MBY4995033.1 G5 domain-containing protein [Streptococcus suis]